MAKLNVEHTADGGRELVYRVRVYPELFDLLCTTELKTLLTNQFGVMLCNELARIEDEFSGPGKET
ncbi:hypothetical protein LCGC14_2554810 [marine sediment metagenome]|uniref:Uncharacterized protein n=1 Tax=marine sediment metagenome TaxID=412755 RepID=A0A0F9CY06_9ZZZZ